MGETERKAAVLRKASVARTQTGAYVRVSIPVDWYRELGEPQFFILEKKDGYLILKPAAVVEKAEATTEEH